MASEPEQDDSGPATVTEELAGGRLDKACASLFASMTRNRLKALILEGRVTVEGETVTDPSRKVAAGEAITVDEPPPLPAEPQAEDIPLTILFEDEHLIVLDKPAGMVVHPAPGAESGTLVNALLHHCAGSLSGIGGVERPGIVHRIDKETSGLLVVAKTDKAHQGLSAQFQDHSIERAYLAFVRGAPRVRSGSVDKPIARSRHDRKKMAVARTGGRRAVTHYTLLERYGGQDTPEKAVAGLMECRLETGRTHQIRVHMADLGHPVLGDPVYGRAKALLPRHVPDFVKEFVAKGTRQALHARLLGFDHPATGEPISFESPLPEDLARLQTALTEL